MTIKSKHTTWIALLVVVASFLVVHFFFLFLPNVFEPWNAQTVDQLFILRSFLDQFRPGYDSTIIHVDIFDRSLLRLRNQYLSRSEFAEVVRNLDGMGVAAQVWDFIFPARTNLRDDSALIAATKLSRNVYYGLAFRLRDGLDSEDQQTTHKDFFQYLERTRWNLTVEGDTGKILEGASPLGTFFELVEASRGTGYLNLVADRDGVYRRTPLIIKYNGTFQPSISLRVICDYLNVSPDRIVLKPGKALLLKDAYRPGKRLHDIDIPIDDRGNMMINYVGSWESMKHYDFADILLSSGDREEMELWKEELAGKIALISQVTTGSADIGPIPVDPTFPKSAIHANIMHTILTENFLVEVTSAQMFLIEMFIMLLVFILSNRHSSISLSLGIVALLIGYLVVAAFLFLSHNTILNIIRPSLMVVLALLGVVGYRYVAEEKSKEVLRRSFESYFPPAVVKRIIADPALVTSIGQKKEITILFSDIAGFTKHVASMAADEIQKVLNEYFGAMTDIVFTYGGTLDKFIGDGLMVFFGDPEPQPDHALRCVRTAIDMQKKVRELRERWTAEGKMPFGIRIGINTGTVVVGNMGSPRRLSYTALGSDVNLAQRLETIAPVGGILISQKTFDLLKNQVVTRPLGQMHLRGIDEPINVYEVPVDGQQLT